MLRWLDAPFGYSALKSIFHQTHPILAAQAAQLDIEDDGLAHLNKVARQLNERPRETLQFETPVERFNACVASTG